MLVLTLIKYKIESRNSHGCKGRFVNRPYGGGCGRRDGGIPKVRDARTKKEKATRSFGTPIRFGRLIFRMTYVIVEDVSYFQVFWQWGFFVYVEAAHNALLDFFVA